MEIPHVVVKLNGPSDLKTGVATDYEVVVQNADHIVLEGLILRMELPSGVELAKPTHVTGEIELEKADDGATLLTWTVTEVLAGRSVTLPLALTAVKSLNFGVAIEWTVFPQADLAELSVAQADLQLALEGPTEVERSATTAYRMRVTNQGNAAARNVYVEVDAASKQASRIEIGDLAPGQSEVIEMDLTFEKAGRMDIGAKVTADGDLRSTTLIAVKVCEANLSATVKLPSSVAPGGNVSAVIAIKNDGDGPAQMVSAQLVLPGQCVTTKLPQNMVRQGDTVTWRIDRIEAGAVESIAIELQLASFGQQELKLACTGPSGMMATANAITIVEAYADLKLSVNEPPAPAPIGQPVTYEVRVVNRGTKEARNVKVVAQFSDGIEPQNAKGFRHRIVPGQVLFDPIPIIAAGQTISIPIVAQATVGGMHRFRAEVRCDETQSQLVNEESTRYRDGTSRTAAQPGASLTR